MDLTPSPVIVRSDLSRRSVNEDGSDVTISDSATFANIPTVIPAQAGIHAVIYKLKTKY